MVSNRRWSSFTQTPCSISSIHCEWLLIESGHLLPKHSVVSMALNVDGLYEKVTFYPNTDKVTTGPRIKPSICITSCGVGVASHWLQNLQWLLYQLWPVIDFILVFQWHKWLRDTNHACWMAIRQNRWWCISDCFMQTYAQQLCGLETFGMYTIRMQHHCAIALQRSSGCRSQGHMATNISHTCNLNPTLSSPCYTLPSMQKKTWNR